MFIHCTFLQILATEITHDAALHSLIAVLLGFGLMCCLAAVLEGSDGENGSVNGTSFESLPLYPTLDQNTQYNISKPLSS